MSNTDQKKSLIEIASDSKKLPTGYISFVKPFNIVLKKKHYLLIMLLLQNKKSLDYMLHTIGWSVSKYNYTLRDLRDKFKCESTLDLVVAITTTDTICEEGLE